MELLIGCGSNHTKQMSVPDKPEWDHLVTLDMNGDHKPDVIHDLSKPLPSVFERCGIPDPLRKAIAAVRQVNRGPLFGCDDPKHSPECTCGYREP